MLAVVAGASARADDGQPVAAVSSRVSLAYSRARLPGGGYRAETYTFGDGGRLPGPVRDDSIDRLTFLDVARAVAGPLEKRNFFPVKDRNPENTQLLIMIYWGTTSGNSDASDSSQYQNLQRDQASGTKQPSTSPQNGAAVARAGAEASEEARVEAATQNARQSSEDAEMASVLAENWRRDQGDARNAMLLGYDTALSETDGVGSTPLTHYRDDLIAEIEEDRYFVVVMAYDYQALWKHRKHSLLWVTRISVRAQGTNFTRVLPSMVSYASQFFGVSSNGLLRRPIPEGRVDIGEPKSLGTLP
jgi:hypothetical protein